MPGLTRARRVRSPRDFAAVRATGRAVRRPALVLGWRSTDAAVTQFGFVVGKRNGNAVTRNRIKRQLRAIVQQYLDRIMPGMAIVMTARPPAAEMSFAALEREVQALLQRAKLWREDPSSESAPVSVPTSDPQGRDQS